MRSCRRFFRSPERRRRRDPYNKNEIQHMTIAAKRRTRRTQCCYFVYVLASLSGTLYVGLTDNLWKRVQEHEDGLFDGFTRKYRVNRLMYFEIFSNLTIAADRE